MDFLEKDLEQIVYKASNEQLDKCGLRVRGKRFRQKIIGNYGVCDMITVQVIKTDAEYYYYNVTIYELKKENVELSTFTQTIKYARGIISYLEKRTHRPIAINIVLIGRKVNLRSDVVYLPRLFSQYAYPSTGINSLQIYTYDYKIDGLSFIELSQDYLLANEGFKL
jgi:hypothetical protein